VAVASAAALSSAFCTRYFAIFLSILMADMFESSG
jgi:hypothetical protein